MSDLALANVEALAQGEEGWGPIVIKDCYTAFSGYDSNIYLTCSQYSSDVSVSYPCGVATTQKPAWGGNLNWEMLYIYLIDMSYQQMYW